MISFFAFYNKINEFGKIISCACINVRKKLDINLEQKEICIIRSSSNFALVIVSKKEYTSFIQKIHALQELIETCITAEDRVNDLKLNYLKKNEEIIGFQINDLDKINRVTIMFSFPLRLKLKDDSFLEFSNIMIIDNYSKAISIVLKSNSENDYRIVEFLPNVLDISDLKLVAGYSYVEV
ncbi:MAG: hypothetical protein N3E37_00705 [Candidatus Micrarchaeota archaeon]|nr:hypothetical protein [Candidatus Micrarchaeota archaeon]